MPALDPKKTRITPRGTAVWPKLTEPETKFKKEGVYTIRMVFSADDEAALIEDFTAQYEEAYVENLKKEQADAKAKKKIAPKELKRADFPWKAQVEKSGPDGEAVETGRMEFNFKMTASGVSKKTNKPWTRKPGLVDAKGASLYGDSNLNISGGSIVKVAYTVSPFFTPLVGSGISLRLEAVQVIELVKYGEKSASDYGFGQEDGYSHSPEEGVMPPDAGATVDESAEF